MFIQAAARPEQTWPGAQPLRQPAYLLASDAGGPESPVSAGLPGSRGSPTAPVDNFVDDLGSDAPSPRPAWLPAFCLDKWQKMKSIKINNLRNMSRDDSVALQHK